MQTAHYRHTILRERAIAQDYTIQFRTLTRRKDFFTYFLENPVPCDLAIASGNSTRR